MLAVRISAKYAASNFIPEGVLIAIYGFAPGYVLLVSNNPIIILGIVRCVVQKYDKPTFQANVYLANADMLNNILRHKLLKYKPSLLRRYVVSQNIHVVINR